MAGSNRETLLHHLLDLAATRPDDIALTVVDDAHPDGTAYTYQALMQRAQHCAQQLQALAAPGDRVMLVLDTGIHYVSAFFGCLLARMIAVPAFPPESLRPQHLARLNAIADDCGARVAVTDGALANTWTQAHAIIDMLDMSAENAGFAEIAAIAASGVSLVDIHGRDVAFLQYTSGSTATPKGVMVTHANIMANEAAIAAQFGTHDGDVMLSWLPLYHDMGLIGGLMHPLSAGVPLVLMSPAYFLQRPGRWLDTIARFRATLSGGPDFAFRLCVDRIRDAQAASLDLRSWRLAFCGAEPIRAETMTRFAERFAPAGFSAQALYPCYGMAEATLFVSGGQHGSGAHIGHFDASALASGRAESATDGTPLVACGVTPPHHVVDIRDPQSGASLPDGQIGEICIAGPSIAQGYWQRPDATAEVFLPDGALRSGDLGFRANGQLYIAGRRKDLIIVRGHNVYPQDVEMSIEQAVDVVRRGRVAAFPYVHNGDESIGVAAEMARNVLRFGSPEAVARAIRAAVAESCGEAPALILLLMPGELPRTTSGKLQRSRCLPAWRAGELDVWAAIEGEAVLPAPSSNQPPLTPAQQALADIWHDVIGTRPTHADDNFFALGGNSVHAAQVVARVREQLNAGFALHDLFGAPTLGACADVAARPIDSAAPAAMASWPEGKDAPLSPLQRGLWVLWSMAPDSGAYNVGGVMTLAGRFDAAALQRAIDALVARHAALRTQIVLDAANQPLQRILPASPVAVEQQACHDAADADRTIRAWSEQPFALTTGPAFRVLHVSISDTEARLALGVHHLYADGWSMNVIVDDFSRLYESALTGNMAALATLTVRHVDLAADHARTLAATRGASVAYWKQALGQEPVVLELPTDRPRAAQASGHGHVIDFAIDAPLAVALRGVARQQGTTLFSVLLATWHALLHRYTGQNDIRVGVPVSARDALAAERVVGYFINTQTVRAEVDGTLPFSALVQRIALSMQNARPHLSLPFEDVVEALQPDRTLSHNPLFQVKFNLGLPVNAPATLGGHALHAEQIEGDVSRFDLALDIIDTRDANAGLSAQLRYATDLFDAVTIDRMRQHYLALLAQIAAQPETVVALLKMADDDTAPANAPTASVDVIEAWQRAVQQNPAALALSDESTTMTRAEADAWADGVASALQARGIGREDVVAIDLERSVPLVVTLLGVLKAGAIALPLDVAQPTERRRQLAQSAGARLVIGNLDSMPSLAFADVRPTDTHRPATTLPGQGAYLIFTSGSTGTPKGVLISRQAIAHYVAGVLDRLDLPADASMAMVSTPAADLGHTVLFGALASGRALHLLSPADVMDGERMGQTMRRHNVGVLKIVPSHLRALLQTRQPADVLPHAALVLGGESAPAALLDDIRALRPGCRIFNHYGPTETTVGVVTHALRASDATMPIGMPLPAVRAYVLDASLSPMPDGLPGELFLGGGQLARGYLRAAAHTAERFLPDPFVKGGRMYRTGDRVRRDVDGQLHYLGRADEQVKIRGYRVEPAEISRVLRDVAGVTDSAVIVRDSRLIAYCVLPDATPAQVLAAATARLPSYMVPAQIVALDRLPVTTNGKLDKRALPDPVFDTTGNATPENDTETLLAGIWQDVLGLERVGVTDNFFELGGDSILSIQTVSRARKAGLRFTPKDLFQHQTIRALARVTTAATPATARTEAPTGDVPLLPIQRAFLAADMPHRHHWNQAVLLHPAAPLDAARLRAAIVRVVAHHDALRLRFAQHGDHWSQQYAPSTSEDLLWPQTVDSHTALAEACNRAQRSLDIANGPLLRAALLTLPDQSQRLLIAIHHLAVDGVSWRILLEDLQQAYRSDAALPARTSSYQTWARRLQQHAATIDDQLDFWRAQHAPTPCQAADTRLGHAATVKLTLSRDHTRALLSDVHAAYRTQINDVLLAALARAVGQWRGLHAVSVLLEGHGRVPIDETIDLSRTVGWFTTAFPVRLPVTEDWRAHIQGTKEALRAIPQDGLGFGLLEPKLADLPRPAITFNYLGQFDQSFGDNALFALADEAPGDSRDPDARIGNAIVINGMVRDGALQLDVTFADASLSAFTGHFQAALEDLVEHCLRATAGALSPSDVPLARLSQSQLDALPGHIDDIYPLTPMQHGMLFHAMHDPDAALYVNQLSIDLDGLDAPRFKQAWDATIAAHDILRTAFLHVDGAPLQAVLRTVPSPVFIEPAGDADALAQQDRAQPFSVDRAPLMRVRLVQQADRRYRMIWTSHHLLLDGWSTARLMGEVLQRYHGLPVASVAARYRDHIAWLQAQDASASQAFWQARLPQLESPTLLAQALPSPVDASPGHAVRRRALDARALQQAAQAHRVTLNTLMQAAWVVVLQRYTGQRTVTFGATVAGRPATLPGADALLGLFINTLPVIQSPLPQQRIADWLQALQQENAALREHEHVPLYDIQRWANQGGQPLFDSILVFENYPIDAALRQREQNGLRIGNIDHAATTNYPLTLVIAGHDTLDVAFSYASNAFSDDQVAQIERHFHAILAQIATDPSRAVSSIVLDDAPRVSAEDDRFRHAEPVHIAIARRAAVQPDAIAVRCGSRSITYAQLEQSANQLAQALLARVDGSEPVVGVLIDRTPDMIVRLLAVLKAGAAYLPIDPELPSDRIAQMIEGAGVQCLLGSRALRIDACRHTPTLDMEDAVAAPARALPAVRPAQLAYLIYTSGSTGKAKAVAVEHGPLAMHCHATAEQYGMAPGERELHFLSFSFDGAHERWMVPLVAGAEVVLRDDELWSAERTLAAFTLHGITNAGFPPAYLMRLTDAADPDAPPLRLLSFGGEAISRESFQRVRRTFRPRTLINGYGPTEAVVTPLAWVADADTPCTAAYAPIGRPVGSRHVYLLDADLHPVPQGAIGELYIGGYGLARGYVQRAALTAEGFLPDPFVPGARMYRTGDLVRQAPDGAVEYVSRRDHQIKVRGYRIEPGEIEARLRANADVRAAIAIAVPTRQGTQLVAYVAGTPDVAALRAHLAESLPAYMVPAQIIALDQLPVTPNGKIDRHALPEPVFTSTGHAPPVTEREVALARIWQPLLGVERVGIHDNFFELGGHSLLLTQLVSQLHREMGLTVSLRDAMAHPTIAGLAAWLDARPAAQQDTARQLSALDGLMADLEAS